MSKEALVLNVVDNIANYLKYQILDKINMEIVKTPIFDNVINIMHNMNDYTYSYTLKDIDDKLFDKLIAEIVSLL